HRDPDQCHVHIQILRQAGADAGKFLIVGQPIEPSGGAVRRRRRPARLAAAFGAKVRDVLKLGATTGAVHGCLPAMGIRSRPRKSSYSGNPNETMSVPTAIVTY